MAEDNLREVGKTKVIKIPRKPIYKGNFAKVYFGKFDGKNVAVKKLDESEKNSQAELQYLRDFQHENIVRYLYMDTDPDEDSFFIVLEKCECTLKDFINERKCDIPPLEILWGVTHGLVYLHEYKRLVHRDLKPSNVLMYFGDGKWVPRISDFGISKTIDLNKTKVTQTSISGTVGYSSPEALRQEKLDSRADIFSLGAIYIYVLSGGKDAFLSDALRLEYDIREGNVKPNLEDIAEDAKTLISSMTAHDREDRPWIRGVMAHHLFWDGEKKITFIQEVSDMIISVDSFPKLEEKVDEIVGDWRDTLYKESSIVEEVFRKMHAKKQKNGVCDLLRNIRNLKNHYNEKPEGFKEYVGTMPDGVVRFFERLFPKLIPYVYEAMRSEMESFNLEKFYKFKGHSGLDLSRSPSRPDGAATVNEKSQGYISMAEEKNDKLVLRKYQWELAESAIAGNNTLIVAPTGSGKTAVLTGIIQDRISKKIDGCIIFLVPSTALAHQQYEFLTRYLDCSVEKIIGEFTTLAPPGEKILANVVTVMTPQVLINELTRKSDERSISFKNISMLLFDECHNANKKHPFKQILDLFHDAKQDRKSSNPQIQIVGVTASPGVGKHKDRAKVKANLLELMASLNVTLPPTTVKANLDELERHQNEIAESYVKVPTETKFGNDVKKTMAEIENEVKAINERNGAERLNKIPGNRSNQSYEKWTEDLKQHGKLDLRDQESARILITYAEHLNMYNFLLQLKDLVPNAMTHASEMVTFQEEGFENEALKAKYQALQAKSVNLKVPMLDRLFDIIKNEFTSNADARCIVFVKRKLTAKSLEECMSQNPDLSRLNPKFLTGTHKTGLSEEMTKVVQDNVIKAFRSGETKVIIATSVAEEGIDIKECNLVIMYNYVTGEVGRIQRKGRSRASGSRSILITSVGSDHLRLEQDNIVCARATNQAIDDVSKMSLGDLKKQIQDIQQKQIAERKRKLQIISNQNDSPSNWEILCGKCKNFLTVGSRLRHIEDTHIVVQDPGFEKRVVKEVNPFTKGPHIIVKGDFLCSNPKCRIKVAVEMVHKQSTYPTLSIKKILLRKQDGTLKDPKKKSNFPFTVTKSIDDVDENLELNMGSADDSFSSVLNEDNYVEALEMLTE